MGLGSAGTKELAISGGHARKNDFGEKGESCAVLACLILKDHSLYDQTIVPVRSLYQRENKKTMG